jgi:hypothetical protein
MTNRIKIHSFGCGLFLGKGSVGLILDYKKQTVFTFRNKTIEKTF